MIGTVGSIAAGGALGALARHYTVSGLTSFFDTSFPWGTLTVNTVGSFLMGLIVGIFATTDSIPDDLRMFFTAGFLGAFTTFSAFSLDAMVLWSKGNMLEVLTYVSGSVIFSLTAIFLGSFLVWKLAG